MYRYFLSYNLFIFTYNYPYLYWLEVSLVAGKRSKSILLCDSIVSRRYISYIYTALELKEHSIHKIQALHQRLVLARSCKKPFKVVQLFTPERLQPLCESVLIERRFFVKFYSTIKCSVSHRGELTVFKV